MWWNAWNVLFVYFWSLVCLGLRRIFNDYKQLAFLLHHNENEYKRLRLKHQSCCDLYVAQHSEPSFVTEHSGLMGAQISGVLIGPGQQPGSWVKAVGSLVFIWSVLQCQSSRTQTFALLSSSSITCNYSQWSSGVKLNSASSFVH